MSFLKRYQNFDYRIDKAGFLYSFENFCTICLNFVLTLWYMSLTISTPDLVYFSTCDRSVTSPSSIRQSRTM